MAEKSVFAVAQKPGTGNRELGVKKNGRGAHLIPDF
jgi:hypothetical protein